MQTANINIRTDYNLKKKADSLYNKLGLNMSTAINMFLAESVRTKSLPLSLKLDEPNEKTIKRKDTQILKFWERLLVYEIYYKIYISI